MARQEDLRFPNKLPLCLGFKLLERAGGGEYFN